MKKFNKNEWILKNRESKRYYCEKCDMAFSDNYHLNTHLDGKKHNDRYIVYKCPHEDCDYVAKTQYTIDKHSKCRKHQD